MTALAVLVTTGNEEANAERCLRSVHGWDSESTDRWAEISRPSPKPLLKKRASPLE